MSRSKAKFGPEASAEAGNPNTTTTFSFAFITEVVQALALHDIEGPGLQVSVNLSARQFEDKDLPGFIAMTVADAGLLPACLQFELTETSLVQNKEAARQFLQDLRDRGFSVALDDSGVGYSSLTYFAQFPVDVVKLDRSFVEQLPDSETACVGGLERPGNGQTAAHADSGRGRGNGGATILPGKSRLPTGSGVASVCRAAY